MARRSRGPIRFVRPAPRTKMWIGMGVGSTAVPGSSATLVTTLTAGALLLRPFTVLRTRGIYNFRSDQIVASEAPAGDFGFLIVTDTAAALGITAIPNPVDEPEAAWFAVQQMQAHFRLLSSVGFETATGREYTVDDKSMRKVGPDDNLVGVFGNSTAVGGTLFTAGRRLIQLH